MNKPTKPNVSIPESFANNGTKTDFSETKIENGFERFTPEILAGDNLNKFIDDTYKGLNYSIKTSDAVNLINDEEILTFQNNSFRTLPLQNPTAYSTGKTSEDKILFNELVERKHSTFDATKFTIAGEPTVTDDGVVSGFSIENYLTIQSVDLSKPFKFSGTFTTGTDIYHSQAVFGGMSTPLTLGVHLDGYPIIYYTPSSGSGYMKLSKIVSANTTYHYTLTFDGTNLTFNLTDGALYNLTGTPSNLNISGLGVISSFYIGRNSTGSYIMQPDATIDLKNFSITVDGREFFWGNRTGLDVIKPDNYIVRGTPTISADGVASGFSGGSNYIAYKHESIKYSKLKIDLNFTVNKTSNNLQTVAFLYGDSINIGFYVNDQANLFNIGMAGGTRISVPINPKENVSFLIEYDNSNWIVKNKNTGETYSFIYNINDVNFTAVTLGSTSLNNDLPFYGSIDLNAFKIYVNGNLVYQPCLKIPYTESKTGSKIVDIAYRDRVIDLYEQEGQAGYYTIDEENQNFTLPMGEIYGMIAKKVDVSDMESKLNTKADKETLDSMPSIQAPYIKDTYVNGTSGYRIWSDGYCKQWGRTQVSIKQDVTVTFLKEFKNTDYTVSHTVERYSSNTVAHTDDTTVLINSVSTTGMGLFAYDAGENIYTTNTRWEVSGYLAEGQY